MVGANFPQFIGQPLQGIGLVKGFAYLLFRGKGNRFGSVLSGIAKMVNE